MQKEYNKINTFTIGTEEEAKATGQTTITNQIVYDLEDGMLEFSGYNGRDLLSVCRMCMLMIDSEKERYLGADLIGYVHVINVNYRIDYDGDSEYIEMLGSEERVFEGIDSIREFIKESLGGKNHESF